MPACPLPLEALPKVLHKHVEATAPLALRLMGAKGLVPAVAPADMTCLLFTLSFDLDATVAATAARTAEALPDKIWGVALRAEGLRAPVLDWLADRFAGKDPALELIVLNPSTPDETIARLARGAGQSLCELVRQNELRLLRHDGIIRALCQNAAALVSTVDGACDFCVRNGLTLLDVPRLVEAHLRVHGIDPTVHALPPQETADALMAEYARELAHDEGPEGPPHAETPEESEKKLTITQRVARMSVSEKIKLATLGNKEARTLLLRDANKLVCMAAATSPRITDGEIIGLANSRTANADVLRYIYSNREFLRHYAVKISLVKNPKVPLPTALKLLVTLQEKDIKELARDRNVPQTVQAQAKAHVMKREQADRGPSTGKH